MYSDAISYQGIFSLDEFLLYFDKLLEKKYQRELHALQTQASVNEKTAQLYKERYDKLRQLYRDLAEAAEADAYHYDSDYYNRLEQIRNIDLPAKIASGVDALELQHELDAYRSDSEEIKPFSRDDVLADLGLDSESYPDPKLREPRLEFLPLEHAPRRSKLLSGLFSLEELLACMDLQVYQQRYTDVAVSTFVEHLRIDLGRLQHHVALMDAQGQVHSLATCTFTIDEQTLEVAVSTGGRPYNLADYFSSQTLNVLQLFRELPFLVPHEYQAGVERRNILGGLFDFAINASLVGAAGWLLWLGGSVAYRRVSEAWLTPNVRVEQTTTDKLAALGLGYPQFTPRSQHK